MKNSYAVAGANAVALWVSRVDESTVRNTQDARILICRGDFAVAKKARESAGFIHRHTASMETLLDGPDVKARDAVNVAFANEKVHIPDITESEHAEHFAVLSLPTIACANSSRPPDG